ncbi:response regulator, partial [Rhizobium leguminosarum]|uniref:response regulator n=1 Tax=Rhizobium leguminosarum TaxID=384 RepID=UPI003F9C6229
ILIVDDSEDDFEATMRAFKRTNLRNSILWAASGQEALDMLAEMVPKPGLILLDLNIPVLDGRKTLEAIKSNAGWRKIPVVKISSDCRFCSSFASS